MPIHKIVTATARPAARMSADGARRLLQAATNFLWPIVVAVGQDMAIEFLKKFLRDLEQQRDQSRQTAPSRTSTTKALPMGPRKKVSLKKAPAKKAVKKAVAKRVPAKKK